MLTELEPFLNLTGGPCSTDKRLDGVHRAIMRSVPQDHYNLLAGWNHILFAPFFSEYAGTEERRRRSNQTAASSVILTQHV